jgi:hypothetical protein
MERRRLQWAAFTYSRLVQPFALAILLVALAGELMIPVALPTIAAILRLKRAWISGVRTIALEAFAMLAAAACWIILATGRLSLADFAIF